MSSWLLSSYASLVSGLIGFRTLRFRALGFRTLWFRALWSRALGFRAVVVDRLLLYKHSSSGFQELFAWVHILC